jgi:hypothetical protein
MLSGLGDLPLGQLVCSARPSWRGGEENPASSSSIAPSAMSSKSVDSLWVTELEELAEKELWLGRLMGLGLSDISSNGEDSPGLTELDGFAGKEL